MTYSGPLNQVDLNAQAEGLREFACSLIGNSDEADDAVQEAMLTALLRPPRENEKLGAWLRTVTRRVISNNRRSKETRRHHERLAARLESALPTGEPVGRESFLRMLGEVVEGVGEPYSPVLRLRFFEEMAAADIAEKLGRPVGTIKSQLARGLDRVRAELDRRYDGDSAAWSVLLIGVTGLRPKDFGMRAAMGASVSTALWIALKTNVFLAGIVTVTLASALFALIRFTSVEPLPELAATQDAPSEKASSTLTDPGDSPLSRVDENNVETPKNEEVIAQASPERIPRFASDGTPLPLVRIHVQSSEGAPASGAVVRLEYADRLYRDLGVTDSKGTLEVEVEDGWFLYPSANGQEGTWINLVAIAPQQAASALYHFDLEQGDPAEITLQLRGPSSTLRVRVVDENGAAIEGAFVSFRSEEEKPPPSEHVLISSTPGSTTGADGTYENMYAVSGMLRVQAIKEGFLPRVQLLPPTASGLREETIVLDRGATLLGTVRHPDGHPVQGAEVFIEPLRTGSPITIRTQTDEEGRYELTGLQRGKRTFWATFDDGTKYNANKSIELEPQGDSIWDVQLQLASGLRIVVVDERGDPLPGWQVFAKPSTDALTWRRLLRTDGDGVAQFMDTPSVALDAHVSPIDPLTGAPESSLPVASMRGLHPDGTLRELVVHDASLQYSSVRGTLLSAEGKPLPRGAALVLTRSEKNVAAVLKSLLPNGSFTIDALPPGEYELAALHPLWGEVLVASFVAVPESPVDLGTLRAPAPAVLLFDWRGFKDRDDITVALSQVRPADEVKSLRILVAKAHGYPDGFRVFPGLYQVRVRSRGKVLQERWVRGLASEEVTVLLGEDAPRSLALRVELPLGATLAGPLSLEARRVEDDMVLKYEISLDRDGQLWRGVMELPVGSWALSAKVETAGQIALSTPSFSPPYIVLKGGGLQPPIELNLR